MNKNLRSLAMAFSISLFAIAAHAEVSITSVSPADGSTISKFSRLEVTTTDNSQIEYGNFTLGDIEGGTYITGGEIKNVDGVLVWESSGLVDYELLKGVDYPCVIKLAATEMDYWQGTYLCETTVTYHGDADGFAFSPVKFIGAEPSSGYEITVAEDFTGSLTFSGPAYLNNGVDSGIVLGMGAGLVGFDSLTPNEDNTVWTFVIGASFLEQQTNSFDLSFMPRDAEGMVIQGNVGDDETSYISLSYLCFLGAPKVDVIPEAGTYSRLDKITFKCDKNISPSYFPDLKPVIIDPMETVICELGRLKQVDKYTIEMTVLNPETGRPMFLTAPDEYTLVVPSQYFCLGEQFDGSYNASIRINYVIDGTLNTSGVLYVDPVDGSDVRTLKTISIDYEGMVAENPNFDGQAEIRNESGEVVAVATKDDITYKTRINNIVVTFSEEVVEPGKYTVHIPQGLITLYGRYDSAELNLEYTVLGPIDPSTLDSYAVSDPDPATYPEELQSFTITFPNAKGRLATWGFMPKIECKELGIADYTIVDAVSEMFDSAAGTVTFSFAKKYTSPGVYVLSIPAASLWIENGDMFPEIKFEYTIKDTSVKVMQSEVVISDVYTIDGVCVMKNASVADLNNLPRGIYIMGGRKIAVTR